MMNTRYHSDRLFLSGRTVLILLATTVLMSCSGAATEDSSAGSSVGAQESATADLHLMAARLHSPAPGQPVSAGYFTLMNHGDAPVTLVNVESSAADVEMHTTRVEAAGTSMRPLENVLIAPDASAVFRRGGHHLMIRNVTPEALAAKSLPVTLVFADGRQLKSHLAIVPMDEWMQNKAGDHSMH